MAFRDSGKLGKTASRIDLGREKLRDDERKLIVIETLLSVLFLSAALANKQV